MNWNEEKDKLTIGTDFLKLEAGQHKITFLDDGEERVVQWEDQEILKVYFRVLYNSVEYTWSVTKGKTVNSLFGQITAIGANKETLVNQTITVIVKGQGKTKDYTVLEAIDLTQ